MSIELKAIFRGERIRFDNSDVAIGSVDLINEDGKSAGDASIKGSSDPDELQDGIVYLFFGNWSNYRNKRTGKTEKQFQFQTFVEAAPIDRESLIAYIAKYGKGNGVGRVTAGKIVTKFRDKTMSILRDQPEIIASLFPVSRDQANALAVALRQHQDYEQCFIGLIGLLNGRGFSTKLAGKLIKKFGNKAPSIIKRNPFRLMEFPGCGFKRCDKMYLQLGHDPSRLKRQAYCVMHQLASDSSGSTWLPIRQVTKSLEGLIGKLARPKDALTLAKRAGRIRVKKSDGQFWVADGQRATDEAFVAHHIAKAMTGHLSWESDSMFADSSASEHQVDAVDSIKDSMISILGGSPGTGKTFTAACCIKHLEKEFGSGCVAVAAPTGKAAVRITEAMRDYRLDIRATTIHSLLGLGVQDGVFQFTYNETSPLPFRFVLIDESSMIDTSLMAALLRARNKDTIILFVGDTNQLPPVGHGSPLLDMIKAGVSYAELTEVRRNSGRIVEACSKIRDGQSFEFSKKINVESGENFFLVSAKSPEAQQYRMLQATSIAKSLGLDPIWDLQLVCAVNKKSDLSRRSLNTILQKRLNGNWCEGNQPFFVDDKIVNTRNGWFLLDKEFLASVQGNSQCQESGLGFKTYSLSDGNLLVNEKGAAYVANGELAKVITADGQRVVVELSSPKRKIQIYRSKDKASDSDDDTETGCTWELGYALSCHRFQGSEIPIAIVMLDTYGGARMVQSKEWFYTAISRGKKITMCIGQASTAFDMMRRSALKGRKTLLVESIEGFSKEVSEVLMS